MGAAHEVDLIHGPGQAALVEIRPGHLCDVAARQSDGGCVQRGLPVARFRVVSADAIDPCASRMLWVIPSMEARASRLRCQGPARLKSLCRVYDPAINSYTPAGRRPCGLAMLFCATLHQFGISARALFARARVHCSGLKPCQASIAHACRRFEVAIETVRASMASARAARAHHCVVSGSTNSH